MARLVARLVPELTMTGTAGCHVVTVTQEVNKARADTEKVAMRIKDSHPKEFIAVLDQESSEGC